MLIFYINNYENGSNDPSIGDIIILSNFFRISISDIIGNDLSNKDYTIQDGTNRTSVVSENSPVYSIADDQKIKEMALEIERLKIEKETLLEALKEIGKGMKD